jgi:hypothetical protein
MIEETAEVKWIREQMLAESAANYHAVGDEPLRLDAGLDYADRDW